MNQKDKGHTLTKIIFLFAGIFLLSITILWVIIIKIRSPAGKGFVDLEPQTDLIWSMYDSAIRGDVNRYINCFVPESQETIKETLKSKGEDAFRVYLQEMASGVMGVSLLTKDKRDYGELSAQQEAGWEGDIIDIPVEIVYKDNNKLQNFRLKRIGKQWKILYVSSPVLTPQPTPYGKDVNE